VRRATAAGAFWGLLAGMTSVAVVSFTTDISWLWYNVIGTAVVLGVGTLSGMLGGDGARA